MTQGARALAVYLVVLGLAVNAMLWWPDAREWLDRRSLLQAVEVHLERTR